MTDLATLTRRADAAGFERGSHVTLQAVMAWLDACNLPHIAGALSVASQNATLERFRPDVQQAVTPSSGRS